MRGQAHEDAGQGMNLEQMRQHTTRIRALAAKYGASNLRVFGSVARGEASPDSDVDLLVDLPPGYDLLRQRMPLVLDLRDLLDCEVDLVPAHELSPHLRDRVLAEAVPL